MTIAIALIPQAIAIIKAIELARQNPTWSPEQVAATILNATTAADATFADVISKTQPATPAA